MWSRGRLLVGEVVEVGERPKVSGPDCGWDWSTTRSSCGLDAVSAKTARVSAARVIGSCLRYLCTNPHGNENYLEPACLPTKA